MLEASSMKQIRPPLADLVRRPAAPLLRQDLHRFAVALITLALLAAAWRPVRGVIIDAAARSSMGLQERSELLIAALRNRYDDPTLQKPVIKEPNQPPRLEFFTDRRLGRVHCAWVQRPRRDKFEWVRADIPTPVVIIGPVLERLGVITVPYGWRLALVADMDGDGAREVVVYWDTRPFRSTLTPQAWAVVRLGPESSELVGLMVVDQAKRPTGNSRSFDVSLDRDGRQLVLVVDQWNSRPATVRRLPVQRSPTFRTRWTRPGGVLVADGTVPVDFVHCWNGADGPVRFFPDEPLNTVVRPWLQPR